MPRPTITKRDGKWHMEPTDVDYSDWDTPNLRALRSIKIGLGVINSEIERLEAELLARELLGGDHEHE